MMRALAPEGCFSGFSALIVLLLLIAPILHAQDFGPIAIVPLDSHNPNSAASVVGALQVSRGKAVIVASGAVTSGNQTTDVVLPRRGTLRVCASTTIKLAADTSASEGETTALIMAMDHGAVEMSYATSHNGDILLTPDFRILLGAPGKSEVRIRLGQHGDTCVENTGASAPNVTVSSVFDGGEYHVQPGQRVMFQHGSLHEVVDNEKVPCGCPPPLEPDTNAFPMAESAGLAPLHKPAPRAANPNSAVPAVPVEPLSYNSADHVVLPVDAATPAANTDAVQPIDKPVEKKKRGFFKKVGRFCKRIFGAE